MYLDTPEGFGVPLSKDVEKLSDLSRIKVEGALRRSLDFTWKNNSVLSDFFTPVTLDNRTRWIDVTVTVDGLSLLFTRMYVIEKNDESRKWEIEFALPEDHWVELASQKKINTIDYGGYRLNDDNVQTSWAEPKYVGDYTPTSDGNGLNTAYTFPVVDYGGWVDQLIPDANAINPVKMVALEDLRPHVSFVYLLKRGFCEIGWNLQGAILETDWALRLWAYLLRPEYYTGKGYDGVDYGKYCRIIGRTITGTPVVFSTLADRHIYYTEQDYLGAVGADIPFQGDPAKWLCGTQNPLPYTAKFRFSFKMIISSPLSVVPVNFNFNMREFDAGDSNNETMTGEILSDDVNFMLAVGEEKFVTFDLYATVAPGQKCALVGSAPVGGVVSLGMWFRCEPDNQAFTREDEIDLRTALDTELNLLDMSKAWMHLTNGRVETDYHSRTVYFHPERTTNVYEDRVPGFIRDDLPVEDISSQILPDSIKLQFIRPNMKRYTLLAFKDSTDDYIDSLKNLVDPLHSRRILNGEDLPNETQEIKNPVFEPTAERQNTELKQVEYDDTDGPNTPSPFLPVYLDNTDGVRSFEIGPRILFHYDRVRQINPNPVDPTKDGQAAFFFEDYDTPTYFFGYCSQLRTWELDPSGGGVVLDFDGSVVFGRLLNDLFVNFYLGITQDNQGGITIEALMRMSMAQYLRYNFRRFFSFLYEGRQLRVPMSSIRDFVPSLPAPVQFFQSPVETKCCDLPCSCRFESCEYYQDLGVFITQSTMDSLNVSSFKIDNVEILTAPVGLGQLNIVDYGGGSYVTNLVDTLNSIGAPYFVFEYSTRTHDTRGQRFFRIKRPACQSFEIIISDGLDEVYRYTESAQQSQWFGGSWGSIGYAPETFTAPDNCESTIEY